MPRILVVGLGDFADLGAARFDLGDFGLSVASVRFSVFFGAIASRCLRARSMAASISAFFWSGCRRSGRRSRGGDGRCDRAFGLRGFACGRARIAGCGRFGLGTLLGGLRGGLGGELGRPFPPSRALRARCGIRSARAPVGGILFALARPDLALGEAEVVDQRNARRADVGAAAAFDAVEEVVFLRLAENLGAREPVHLERLQVGRAGLGAFAAADAGHLGRRRREQRLRADEDAVGGLDHRHVRVGHQEAHHRPAHDDAVGVRLGAGRVQRRPSSACRTALRSCAAASTLPATVTMREIIGWPSSSASWIGVGGADVEALHAVVGGALAVRHFDAGQDADQLLGAAGRVARRHRDRPASRSPSAATAARMAAMASGLLSSMPISTSLAPEQVAQDGGAREDVLGALAHQHVVAGDEGLALGAVDDQRVDVLRACRD